MPNVQGDPTSWRVIKRLLEQLDVDPSNLADLTLLEYNASEAKFVLVPANSIGISNHHLLSNLNTNDDHNLLYAALAPLTSARNVFQSAADVTPITLKLKSGQTADLLQHQSSSGTVWNRVDSGGNLWLSGPGPSALNRSTANSLWNFTDQGVNQLLIAANGMASAGITPLDGAKPSIGLLLGPTYGAAALRWNDNQGGGQKDLLSIGPNATSLTVGPYGTTWKGIVIQGTASQSANLLELQDSAAAIKSYATVTGDLGLVGEMRLLNSTHKVGFKAPTLAGDTIWTLPAADGTNGQVLATSGGGLLSWQTVTLDLSGAVIKAPATSARNAIQPTGDFVPITLQGASGQSLNLTEWKNFAGTVGASLSAGFDLSIAGELRLTNSAHKTGFKAGTLAGDTIWTLPLSDGTNGQVLTTNGVGALNWGSSVADLSGAVLIAPNTVTRNTIQSTGDFPNLILKSRISQTQPLLEFTDPANTPLLAVNPSGIFSTPVKIQAASVSPNTALLTFNDATGGGRTHIDAYGSVNILMANPGAATGWDATVPFSINVTPASSFTASLMEAFVSNSRKFYVSPTGSVGLTDTLQLFNGSFFLGLKAPALSGSITWTLPAGDGTAGQALGTDGSANLTWVSADTTLRADLANATVAAKGDALVATRLVDGAGAPITGSTAGTLHTLLQNQAINVVVHFGADPTGATDSTAALQAALDFAYGTTGSPHGLANVTTNRSVFIPAGSYKINAPLSLKNVVGARLRGAGRFTTTIRQTTSNTSLLIANQLAYSSIEGIRFQTDGGVTQNSAHALLELWSDNLTGGLATQSVTFKDCFFEGNSAAQVGVRLGGNDSAGGAFAAASGSEFLFSNCFWSSFLHSGVYLNSFNSLSCTLMGGNLQNCSQYGLFAYAGSYNVFGTAFQAGGVAQIDNDGYDIYCSNSVGDVSCFYGVRSESFKAFFAANTYGISVDGWNCLPGNVGGWQSGHVYPQNTCINVSGHLLRVTTAGTSGGTPPSWNLSGSAPTTDGSVTWTHQEFFTSQVQRGKIVGANLPYGTLYLHTDKGCPLTVADCVFSRTDWLTGAGELAGGGTHPPLLTLSQNLVYASGIVSSGTAVNWAAPDSTGLATMWSDRTQFRLVNNPLIFGYGTGGNNFSDVGLIRNDGTFNTATVGAPDDISHNVLAVLGTLGKLAKIGTNLAGEDFYLQGGLSTGNAAGGDAVLRAAAPGSTGAAANNAADILRARYDGVRLLKPVTLLNNLAVTLTSGTGSPEGVVTAPISSLYHRAGDGGSGTSLYVKESGSGNTGWTAIALSGSLSGAVITAPGSSTRNLIQPTADFIPLLVKPFSGQTSDLFQLLNSAGTILTAFSAGGDLKVSNPFTLTSAPADTALNISHKPSGTATSTQLTLYNKNDGSAQYGLISIGSDAVLNVRTGANSGTAGDIVFSTDVSTERMRILEASGNLSVGTASSLARLGVVGAGAATLVAVFRGGATQSGDLTQWQDPSAVLKASISAAGDLFSASSLKLGDGSTHTTQLLSHGSLAGSLAFTFPGTVGTAGQVLTTDGTTGALSWSAGGGTGSGTVTSITQGTGMNFSTNPITVSGTVGLANTAVTPGSYVDASFTVDAQGRITAASSGPAGSFYFQKNAGYLAPITLTDKLSLGIANPTSNGSFLYLTQTGNTGTASVPISGLWIDQTISSLDASAPVDGGGITLKTVYNTNASSASLLASQGVRVHTQYGDASHTATKGTIQNFTSTQRVLYSLNTSSEMAPFMGWLTYGATAASTIGNGTLLQPVGRAWFADFSLHGTLQAQPALLNGLTMLVNNYYNGSPSGGASAGMWIVSQPGQGAGVSAAETGHFNQNTFAVDVGLGITGTASAGAVAFTTGIQVGGGPSGGGSGWIPSATIAAGTASVGTGIDLRNLATRAIQISGGNTSIAWGLNGDPIQTMLDRGAGGLMQLTVPGGFYLTNAAAVNDPMLDIGSAVANSAHSWLLHNPAGSLKGFIAGSPNQFFTGTAYGDGGLIAGGTHSIYFAVGTTPIAAASSAGFDFASIASPQSPLATWVRLFSKSDNNLWFRDPTGREVNLTGAAVSANNLINLTRILPTAVGSEVDIGTWTFTQGAGILRVSVSVNSLGFSVAKTYNLPIQFPTGNNAQYNNVWQRVRWKDNTGAYSGQDFELDVLVNNTAVTLRLYRTAGTTAGTANITIRQEGLLSDTFATSVASAVAAAATSIYQAQGGMTQPMVLGGLTWTQATLQPRDVIPFDIVVPNAQLGDLAMVSLDSLTGNDALGFPLTNSIEFVFPTVSAAGIVTSALKNTGGSAITIPAGLLRAGAVRIV